MTECRSQLVGYAIGFGVALAAILFRWMLDPVVEDRLPFACLMLGVVVVSMKWGLGPGLATFAIGSLMTTWLIMAPRYSFAVAGLPQQASLIAFSCLSIVIAASGEGSKRIRERANRLEHLIERGQTTPGDEIPPASLAGLATHGAADVNELLRAAALAVLPPAGQTSSAHKFEATLDDEPLFQAIVNPRGNQLGKLVLTYYNSVLLDNPVRRRRAPISS